MRPKEKRKRTPRQSYHWDSHALFALFLQSMGFVAFIGWCLEEHIPARISLPPIVIGLLILASILLTQFARARYGDSGWQDNHYSS